MEKSCSVIDWSRMHLTSRIRMRIHTLLTGVSIRAGLSVGRKLYKKIRSTPEELVETVALRQGFIALEPPAFFKKAAPDIAAVRSLSLRKRGQCGIAKALASLPRGDQSYLMRSSIVQYICRLAAAKAFAETSWKKALNSKK